VAMSESTLSPSVEGIRDLNPIDPAPEPATINGSLFIAVEAGPRIPCSAARPPIWLFAQPDFSGHSGVV
jgi:hypothetical protein